ncbi:MAG: glycosyltransferase family 39 protein [Deltaproteobacteria bacterium]|nr:glycosyltransferase family 39 protein [Deltaproteobacteria bacterium]
MRRLFFILLIALFVLIGIFLGSRYAFCGLPYIYDMDEQSHLSRLVEMIREGRWDPEYYRKPALHFYLRIPVTIMTYFVEVYRGALRSFDQIQTTDPYHLGGISSASNPPVLIVVNRFFSGAAVIFGAVFLAYVLFRNIGVFYACCFLFLVFVSPSFSTFCCRLSVDPFCYLFACLVAGFCYKYTRSLNFRHLIVASIFAGLAFSTKYNFWILGLIPVMLYMVSNKIGHVSIYQTAKLVAIPVFIFLVVNPFLLINYRMAIDDFTTQLVHYRSPSGQSFSERLFENFQWLFLQNNSYLSIVGCILGVIFGRTRGFAFTVTLVCVLHILQMSMFKQTFFRNLFPLVPIVTFTSLVGFSHTPLAKIWPIVVILFSCHLFGTTALEAFKNSNCFESRIYVDNWLKTHTRRTFLSGYLGFRNKTKNLPHVEVFKEGKIDVYDLAINGAYFVVTHKPLIDPGGVFDLIKTINGEQIHYVRRNPTINIYQVNRQNFLRNFGESEKLPTIFARQCFDHACRLKNSFTRIIVDQPFKSAFVENIWPWKNSVELYCLSSVKKFSVHKKAEISQFDCTNPVVYVRDIYIPERFRIPDREPFGARIRFKG